MNRGATLQMRKVNDFWGVAKEIHTGYMVVTPAGLVFHFFNILAYFNVFDRIEWDTNYIPMHFIILLYQVWSSTFYLGFPVYRAGTSLKSAMKSGQSQSSSSLSLRSSSDNGPKSGPASSDDNAHHRRNNSGEDKIGSVRRSSAFEDWDDDEDSIVRLGTNTHLGTSTTNLLSASTTTSPSTPQVASSPALKDKSASRLLRLLNHDIFFDQFLTMSKRALCPEMVLFWQNMHSLRREWNEVLPSIQSLVQPNNNKENNGKEPGANKLSFSRPNAAGGLQRALSTQNNHITNSPPPFSAPRTILPLQEEEEEPNTSLLSVSNTAQKNMQVQAKLEALSTSAGTAAANNPLVGSPPTPFTVTDGEQASTSPSVATDKATVASFSPVPRAAAPYISPSTDSKEAPLVSTDTSTPSAEGHALVAPHTPAASGTEAATSTPGPIVNTTTTPLFQPVDGTPMLIAASPTSLSTFVPSTPSLSVHLTQSHYHTSSSSHGGSAGSTFSPSLSTRPLLNRKGTGGGSLSLNVSRSGVPMSLLIHLPYINIQSLSFSAVSNLLSSLLSLHSNYIKIGSMYELNLSGPLNSAFSKVVKLIDLNKCSDKLKLKQEEIDSQLQGALSPSAIGSSAAATDTAQSHKSPHQVQPQVSSLPGQILDPSEQQQMAHPVSVAGTATAATKDHHVISMLAAGSPSELTLPPTQQTMVDPQIEEALTLVKELIALFLVAEKEVFQLIRTNLYESFIASREYKQALLDFRKLRKTKTEYQLLTNANAGNTIPIPNNNQNGNTTTIPGMRNPSISNANGALFTSPGSPLRPMSTTTAHALHNISQIDHLLRQNSNPQQKMVG